MTTVPGTSTSATNRGFHRKSRADFPNDVGQQSLNQAIHRTQGWLAERQHDDGFWCGELEGDTILESEYILLLAWLGREDSAIARKAAEYLIGKQLPEGGWSLYPGGPLEISASVKAYWALKLTGHATESEPMERARRAIREQGGADAINSFTRFYLALLGQIPYDACPAVPPEMMLLPTWFPVNIYRISAWSRTIFVPLSIMWAFRPVRTLDESQGIKELFLRDPAEWPTLHCPGLQSGPGWFTWEKFFRTVDGGLKWIENRHLTPLRRRALRLAESWMVERFADSDGLGAIFPPIIWCVVALRCLGYDDDSSEVQYCLDQLEDLMIEEDGAIRLEPCKSPVWDTAIALRALAACEETPAEVLQHATTWLLNKEVRQKGDWSVFVKAEPAGWFFEYRNAFYPDVDDTIMVMMALREAAQRLPRAAEGDDENEARIDPACQRGLDWILAMQNRDGGWGAFDRDNDREFLCHVPFADHNAMIDPSTPDITARVLEALARQGMGPDDTAVQRAIRLLRETQEDDGSWFGRWGINYIYGTWQVLTGMADIGFPLDDPAIVRGAQWLIGCQQPSGGWGESARTYDEPSLRGTGPVTASQTAWAVLGLIAAGQATHPATAKGIEFLIGSQRPAGNWDETDFTGTGFPRVFYLRYHLYSVYFPLLAMARYREAWRTEP